MKIYDKIIDFFCKKKKVHIVYDCLPYYNREVIIHKEGEVPFTGYIDETNASFWLGNCGKFKDKSILISMDDEWEYAYNED